MNIRKIGICDDNEASQKLLKHICTNYYSDKNIHLVVDLYNSGEDLLKKGKKYDYLFLDIEMYNLNGVEVAEIIRKTDIDTMIVIISGYPEYKNKAYSVHVFDYLDKPICTQKIFNLLNELERYFQKKRQTFYVSFKTINGIIQIDVDEIMYIEYFKRRLNINTVNGVYYMYGNIKDIFSKLKKFNFIIPHRAFIVNMNHIERIEKNTICMQDKTNIPISKLKKKEIDYIFLAHLSSLAE